MQGIKTYKGKKKLIQTFFWRDAEAVPVNIWEEKLSEPVRTSPGLCNLYSASEEKKEDNLEWVV